jgi:hypothetical protein
MRTATLFAILSPEQARRINDTRFFAEERHKLDTDPHYCTSDLLPFFLEDSGYSSSAYTNRDYAIMHGREDSVRHGWGGFVMVTLTFDADKLPENSLALYEDTAGVYGVAGITNEEAYRRINTPHFVDAFTRAGTVEVQPMAARFLNTEAKYTLEHMRA